MAGPAERCLRIGGEAAIAHQAGYRVGMLHNPASPDEIVPIAPEIRASMHGTGIEVVDSEQEVEARLLVLHPPFDRLSIRQCMSLVRAHRTVIVPDESEQLSEPGVAEDLRSLPRLTVAPASAAMRTYLRTQPNFRLEPGDWLPLIETDDKPPRSTSAAQLRMGFIIPADWPEAVDAIKEVIKSDPSVEPCIWRDRGPQRQRLQAPASWKVHDGVETSLAWFLRRIDILVLLQGSAHTDLPAGIIATARSAGKPVLAPLSLQSLDKLPAGILLVDRRDMVIAARRLLANPRERAKLIADRDGKPAKLRFLKRLRQLVGPRRPVTRRKTAPGRQKPRVIFLPKGGVGLGHVARLLAIARRAGKGFDPVFVSLSETAGLIEDLGFRAEYIPSAAYAGVRPRDWDRWFQHELEQLIDAYDARAVVFDGSDPPAVLSRAVASRSWCRGVWVRRGMWAPGYNPSLQRSGAYDIIIEPGELAAASDRGATASRRHETLQVDPITLLDPSDLLSREEAAAAIGLDPERPAALIQLGSGENRNILDILDKIVAECRRFPDLQVAIAQWANATAPLNLWPGVRILTGAPLSLYYRAFDFSISAAGYNSFHELVSLGLPTLFVPNRAPGMDDQAARSAFAQDAGAAIELKEHEFDEFPQIFELFMKPAFRSVMSTNCHQLIRKNGAAAAGRAIAELVA